MQTLVATPDTPAPKAPYDLQFSYLRIAIWKIEFLNRFPLGNQPAGRYNRILWRLRQSLSNAERWRQEGEQRPVHGGSALRLANAIWAFEHRINFPDDTQLKIKEEDATGRVFYHHREKKPTQHHVSMALEIFFKLRQKVFGPIEGVAGKKEDIYTPNPVTYALRMLDMFMEEHHYILRERELFKDVLPVIAATHPENIKLLLALIKGLQAYAEWMVRSKGVIENENLHIAYKNLGNVQYEGINFLPGEPKLAHAIHRVLYVLRKAIPPV